jgi:hypothetical protein
MYGKHVCVKLVSFLGGLRVNKKNKTKQSTAVFKSGTINSVFSMAKQKIILWIVDFLFVPVNFSSINDGL